ncbi:YHS domain-containing (seleno)protein [Psychromonas aquimarina]|uniref:YHS domain-containing (seleno)protein n=1 Tax=Psychromonas aquimarina TaxID=444919 RepID=UPI0004291F49|nr:YHS domain-containing (seleno)protein [Psychromonas aquimarina]
MRLVKFSARVLVLLFFAAIGSAQAEEQIYTGFFNNKAASGFDVVAYFSEQKPVEGSSKFTLEYKGAEWYFSTQENLMLFKESPEKYAPQYGGYCAWAMARNKTAPGNAPFWTIYKNKLYLNYDQSVVDTWRADKDAFIKKADQHWAKMEKE